MQRAGGQGGERDCRCTGWEAGWSPQCELEPHEDGLKLASIGIASTLGERTPWGTQGPFSQT